MQSPLQSVRNKKEPIKNKTIILHPEKTISN